MKILLYLWKTYSDCFLKKQLENLGYTVQVWEDDRIIHRDEAALGGLGEELKKGYQAVFSYNYFPIVAIACSKEGIPYMSWLQDSSMSVLYDNTTYLKTNCFFCFDYEQYEAMRSREVLNVHYLPLATDVKALSHVAYRAPETAEKYLADVSFVGSLSLDRNMLSAFESLPDLVKGYLEGMCQVQMRIPEIRFSKARIPEQIMDSLKGTLVFHGMEDTGLPYELLVEDLIDRNVTVMERVRMIQMLSDQFDFKLYTGTDTSDYPQVNNCGTVDYYKEMPRVFRNSKINLNLSLRSIRSGIPLRVLDIIASGGFVLTNYQADLYRYFEEGKSIVTFYNLDDMMEKISYYLLHEEERKGILQESMKVVQKEFDFSALLPKLLKGAGIEV